MFKSFKDFFKTKVGMKDCGEIPKTATIKDVTTGTSVNLTDVSPTQSVSTKNEAPTPPISQ